MYIAIHRHTSQRGAAKGKVKYTLHLSAYQGGVVWARSSNYQTPEAAKRAAGDLFMGLITWSEEHPEGDSSRFHCSIECRVLAPGSPVAASGGEGAENDRESSWDATGCPTKAVDRPLPGREGGKAASGEGTPLSPTQEPNQEPPKDLWRAELRRVKRRPADYESLSPRQQREIDKALRILPWDESVEPPNAD